MRIIYDPRTQAVKESLFSFTVIDKLGKGKKVLRIRKVYRTYWKHPSMKFYTRFAPYVDTEI